MYSTDSDGERTSLLAHQDSSKKGPGDDELQPREKVWRRAADVSIGFALCAILATFLHKDWGRHGVKPNVPVIKESHHTKLRWGVDQDDKEKTNSKNKNCEYTNDCKSKSKYTQFQAMGFQIYTGGAPALIAQESSARVGDDVNATTSTMIHNPECEFNYGHFDDYDVSNATLPSNLWQCYLGHAEPKEDIRHRLEIMTTAVEQAHHEATKDPSVLKIFIAPEFFWRGREGAYVFTSSNASTAPSASKPMLEKDSCSEVCQIMLGLEQLVSQKKYKDWLFLFGTVVVSEALPKEDTYDYLFYNFAPVYKGYDPEMEDHHGKRFLVPKRYVSNVDFLTPLRQYHGNTKELVDSELRTLHELQRDREELKKTRKDDDSAMMMSVRPTMEDDEPTVVDNPFVLMRDFYDRDMWYERKDQLLELGYHMIEYDWLILDNITFTIEVCLDHDARTALNAYLADNVMGSPTRIPKSVSEWDPEAQKYVGSIEKVKIPRHQAQLSLVSSMGMTANPQSLALTNNGTLILQDGQSAKNGSMAYTLDCDTKSWHFDGGSEFISRTANFTSTRIDFQYQVHAPLSQVDVYQNGGEDNTWKEKIKGVFTTTNYEPKITVYPVRAIASV